MDADYNRNMALDNVTFDDEFKQSLFVLTTVQSVTVYNKSYHYVKYMCVYHRYKESGYAIECSVWHYPLSALQSKPTIWPTTFYI